jgi:effector-binding domain-containing protein
MAKYRNPILFITILLIVWIIVPYTLPETLTIRHSSGINAPERVVFVQLNDLRNWENWSPWIIGETPMPVYRNGGFGKGGTAEWVTGNSGTPVQRFTIVKSDPHHMIEIGMDFRDKGFVLSAIQMKEQEGRTILTWNSGMKSEGWKSIFLWLDTKRHVRKASANIRELAELWHSQGIQVVEQGVISAFPFVSIRRQVSWEDLSEAMGNMYEQLIGESDDATYTIIGHAYAVYHSMGEERVDIECGFPIEKVTENRGIIRSGTFPESDCIITEYTGDYDNLEKGHDAVQQWISERGFTLSGPPMEIFVTSAASEADPSAWVTRICYPVNIQ